MSSWIFGQARQHKTPNEILTMTTSFPNIDDESIDTTLSSTASAATGDTDISTPTCYFKKRKAETATSPITKRIELMADVLKNRKEPQNHDWLGRQVVAQIDEIENRELQRNTVWKIQVILNEALTKDDMLKNNEHNNKLHQQARTSSTSTDSQSSSRDILQLSMDSVFASSDLE